MTAQERADALFVRLDQVLGMDPEMPGRQRTLNDPQPEGHIEDHFPVFDLLQELRVTCSADEYLEVEGLVEERLMRMFLESLVMTEEGVVAAEKAAQRTYAWFRARHNRLTASVFGTAVGHNPFDKNATSLLATMLWKKKFTTNQACQYGTDMEPIARDAYEAFMRKHGGDTDLRVVEPGFIVSLEDQGKLGVSADGFVFSKSERMPSEVDLARAATFDPSTDAIQVSADSTRQKQDLPFLKPRGAMSTCFDSNEHVDRQWIMEPIHEIFFDNETLEVVAFNDIPDECFGKIKKVYGKKFDNSRAPKTNWPSPPGKSASAGTLF